MGWEAPLLARLVALANGETVPYYERLVMGLDAPGKGASRNHLGMAIAGEALRAWREFAAARPIVRPIAHDRRMAARDRLIAYLRDELTNGLWGPEVLAATNHCEYHLAVMAFARLVAVESGDIELLDLTGQHCRAHGRLCASLSDPSGEVLAPGFRVRVSKRGEQKAPVHDGLTVLWRLVRSSALASELGADPSPSLSRSRQIVAELRAIQQRPAFHLSCTSRGPGWSDPLYVGLKVARQLLIHGDNLGGMAHEQPGHVPLRHRVLVYRWPGGHQAQIVRPSPKFTGDTRGGKNPAVVADWCRAEYGKGKRGASAVTFGTRWETPPPCVPSGAVCIEMGPGDA